MICENCGEEHNGTYGSGRFCTLLCSRKYSGFKCKRRVRENCFFPKKVTCENCGIVNDGSYGSGRFCSAKCARTYSSMIKREETNKKVSTTLKAKFKTGELKNVGYFTPEARKKAIETRRKNLEKLLERPWEQLSNGQKCKVVFLHQDGNCLRCGIKDWVHGSLTLQLHHINGNNNNWQRTNIVYLCPNCHSQTPNYRGRGGHSYLKTKLKTKPIETKARINKIDLKKQNAILKLEQNLDKKYNMMPWNELPFSRKCKRILQEQNNSCWGCGIKDWMHQTIIFDLHHVDGNRRNSKRDNLMYLCFNCHSQTPNFCGKNVNQKNLYALTDEGDIEDFWDFGNNGIYVDVAKD